MSTIEPIVVVHPQATYPDRSILNGDLSTGLPEWLYDDYTRITPRSFRTAVLYTATGAHDLTAVITDMLSGPAAKTIRDAIDNRSLVGRDDLEYLREQAYEHMRSTWTTWLDGIDL